MEITSVTVRGKDYVFTGVDKDGNIKIGLKPRKGGKLEWFTPVATQG